LTRSIINLEGTLGVRLLVRNARGVEPTPEGRLFFAEAKYIINECQRARDDVLSLATGVSGQIVLGVAPMFMAHIAAQAAAQVHVNVPDVDLVVIEGNNSNFVDMLVDGRIDAYLTNFPQFSMPKALVTERLCTVTAVVVAGASNPISRKRKLKGEDFIGTKWATIGYPQESGAIQQYMSSNGFPPPGRPLRTNSVDLIKSLIIESGFIGMLPNHMLTRELGRNEMKILPMPAGDFHRPAGLIYRARDSHRRSLSVVIDAVRASCQAFNKSTATHHNP
jgi:DNA-binding transcriptional LysR family regulator